MFRLLFLGLKFMLPFFPLVEVSVVFVAILGFHFFHADTVRTDPFTFSISVL